ncbi:MAG: GtrA family protein [Clostridia bacterium]|nr:GtrA family protein [Clostridia bacterium]
MGNDTDNNIQEIKPDIFDKIMHLPGLRVFEPLYKKYKEVLLYLFFGVLTTVVSIGSYAFFNVTCHMNELIANVISWVLAVLFAFFTNRIWVFAAPTKTAEEFIKQLVSFAGGRVATLIVEEIILLVFITLLHFNSIVIKTIAQVVVIVLNYVISKLVIFKKDKEN